MTNNAVQENIVVEAHEIRVGDVIIESMGAYITNRLVVIDCYETGTKYNMVRIFGNGWSRSYEPARKVRIANH